MPDKLLNVHASVPERTAFFVWLGDLCLESDNSFEARREIGHLALLFVDRPRHRAGKPAKRR
jgi:hypothetical protein